MERGTPNPDQLSPGTISSARLVVFAAVAFLSNCLSPVGNADVTPAGLLSFCNPGRENGCEKLLKNWYTKSLNEFKMAACFKPAAALGFDTRGSG